MSKIAIVVAEIAIAMPPVGYTYALVGIKFSYWWNNSGNGSGCNTCSGRSHRPTVLQYLSYLDIEYYAAMPPRGAPPHSYIIVNLKRLLNLIVAAVDATQNINDEFK